MRMKALLRIPNMTAGWVVMILLMLSGTSCVHEWPENDLPKRDIIVNVKHLQNWTYTEMTVTRNDNLPALCRYHFKIYPAGTTQIPVAECEFTTSDLDRNDFSTTISISEGDYDLYVWSDYADGNTSKSYFFDTSDFLSIGYTSPYNGNNELRDGFRGKVSFSVASTIDAEYHQEIDVTLERPFARYEFRATDIMDFIDREITRGNRNLSNELITGSPEEIEMRVPELNKYRVKMIYSGYMPSKFNNILDRPVDSSVGMSYDARITVLSQEEARLGFDYVMVNGHESSVALAMEIYDPDGEMIGRTVTVNVPTKRAQNTVVRGRFLTSQTSGGVGINPDYDGSFNIEI